MLPKEGEIGKTEELKQRKRENHFRREQSVMDAMNRVSILLIYLVFGVVCIGVIAFAYHYWRVDDWETLKTAFYALLAAFFGYIFRHLQDHGMKGDEKAEE